MNENSKEISTQSQTLQFYNGSVLNLAPTSTLQVDHLRIQLQSLSLITVRLFFLSSQFNPIDFNLSSLTTTIQ